ncbi:MAG: HlyD family efflux transporter periplasmic adaptor subunit [Opitutales bacterium]
MKNINLPERAPRLAALALLGAALLLTACTRSGDRGDLVLSGNIEVVHPQLSFKIPGRVAARLVSEGDRVTAGQLVARLDDTELQEQLAAARAALAVNRAALAALEAGSRPQEIATAAAGVRSAEAERERARLDFQRSESLRSGNALAERDYETAQVQLKVAEAQTVEAGENLKLVREGPRIEAIQQGRASVAQAAANLEFARTQLDNSRLVSPLTGVVLSHDIEPGEFVAAGTPVVTVADTLHVWVRAYLNETDLGRLQLGQKVAVRADTFPGKRYEGTVGFIASEAEFTPKTVQTDKERVKLVFRVKVDILNPNDELKAGMPADVLIPVAGR